MATPIAHLRTTRDIEQHPPVVHKPVISSGFATLDRVLPGGGWQIGMVADVLRSPFGGEMALLLPLLATLTQQAKQVYLLAPPYIPYAPALQAAGVDLAHLIWLDPPTSQAGLWATEQIAREPGGAIISWLTHAPSDPQCQRLMRANELGQNVLILIRPLERQLTPTPFKLRLSVSPLPDGTEVQILKRQGAPVVQPIFLQRQDDVVASTVFPVPAARHNRPSLVAC
ncbi:cell division inhibitor SulA [Chitinivorax tropicus]|uniref:Cell division inhibitor SulA n=1 Tax=Chitinivorax tropicus TaxID=714531 RepID=A0A840MZ86_9PROT|nr:DNA lesion error-prone repair protein ImuA [Chitinivorax tropicus]MBB5020461.1 cell division inhibitor SulA [Chitinivorax tropicus]